MKAIYVTEHGGPEILKFVDLAEPIPHQDQVLVEVLYVGVNYIDTYFRSGAYDQKLPYIPGSEGCGRVRMDPQGEIAEGTLVAWHSAPGSYAELVCVPRNRLVSVPDSVDPAVAASMLLQGMTAHYLLHGVREVKAGESLIITAGAGGVGLMLTQMAAALDAIVFSVTSPGEKERLAYEAGATQVFRYGDFARQIKQANGGQGVDVVYDGVGKDTFSNSLAACRPRGLVCCFGSASGEVEPFLIQDLNAAGSLFVTRPSLAHYVATDDEFRQRAQAVVRGVEDGTLNIRVYEPFQLSDAALAHKQLQERKTTGSVVLRVCNEA